VLIDQSLLLGSSSKGVHVHDIVLTYLRGTQSVAELRTLQKRVVEGLVAASMDRTAATGRGFQETGSTAKAFEGEEVDWYVCNVASYHVKQSMDPLLALVENEDLKRWLLADDETILRAAAVAVGVLELELLLAHFSKAEEWVEAAKVAQSMEKAARSKEDGMKHAKTALDLLQQAGSTTTAAQQLELDMRGNLTMTMRTGPDKKRNVARMQELMAQNSSLRIEPLGVFYMSVFPRLFPLFGLHPKLWDAGKIATQDTILEGFGLYVCEGIPLFAKAVEQSVGARKECIRIGYELDHCAQYMGLRSTEQAVEMHQQLLAKKWGEDGLILTAACMDYSFDRHFTISQGIGSRNDQFIVNPCVQGLPEYCGDVQQMVQLFEKQLGAVQDFVKRRVPGMELPMYCFWIAPSFIGSELNALHPFGKKLAALFESCDGRCTDPGDCEEWWGSADWSAFRAHYGKGISSKDGLHHFFLKPTIISTLQAVLSLSLASMGDISFSLSWLDNLPAADDPMLHDSMAPLVSFTNVRVLIAEVLEWRGRHKEAIRYTSARFCMTSCADMFSCRSIADSRLLNYKTNSTSLPPPKCAQGGCSADAMRCWGSMRSRCRHWTQQSSWRNVGASCCQRR
jgi:hypothetical protein